MKYLDPQFLETKVLPVVLAFGLGVLVASHAAVVELEAWADSYAALAQEVDLVRIACGLQPDPAAIAATFVAHQQYEARK